MICDNTDQKKFLITTSIATVLFYFPLVIGSYYYRDDFERLLSQKPGWSELGRPFADILAYFLSADWQWVPDSSPFFLLVALFLTIISTCLSLKIRAIPFNATTAVLVVTYLFNPFLLSAFFYRFDCVIMAMGVACGLLGWAYYNQSKLKSALLCFVSMGFYQSYINMFIVLIVIEALYAIYSGKPVYSTIKFLIKAFVFAACICIATYFFDKLFINEYATGKSQFIFFGEKGVWKYFAVMMENVFSRYFGFLSTTGKILYSVSICLAFIQIQLHFYRHTNFDHPVLRATICSIVFLFMLPISLGVLYGIVGDGVIPPRVMPASIFFSVLIVFLLSRFITVFQQPELVEKIGTFANTKLIWVTLLLLLLCPLVFSYIVNSATRIQNDLNRFYLQRIATSLERYPADKPVVIIGGLGKSLFVAQTTERMRLVAAIIPFANSWELSSELKEFGYNNIINLSDTPKAHELVTQLCANRALPDTTTPYYRIFDLGDYLFISLGKKNMCLGHYNDNYTAETK